MRARARGARAGRCGAISLPLVPSHSPAARLRERRRRDGSESTKRRETALQPPALPPRAHARVPHDLRSSQSGGPGRNSPLPVIRAGKAAPKRCGWNPREGATDGICCPAIVTVFA